MVFELLFGIGILGILVMTLLGSVRFGHGSAHMGHGHVGVGGHGHGSVPGHGHASLPTHGHSTQALAKGAAHAPQTVGHNSGTIAKDPNASTAPIQHQTFSWITLLPSPIDVLAMSTGAGAAGMLAQGHVPAGYLTWIALAGALVFNFIVVRPMFALLAQFASKPSAGLEGTVALNAEAVTRFDHSGQGLVLVNMEGQLVQLLAKLTEQDLEQGVVIDKGDQVVVMEVDSKRNRCLVTRELTL